MEHYSFCVFSGGLLFFLLGDYHIHTFDFKYGQGKVSFLNEEFVFT